VSRRAIAAKVAADMQSASWVREMFERGRRLKAQLGEENVFDFSLGNPNAAPPPEFFDALRAVACEQRPELHGYMSNAGFEETRAAVARFVSREYGLELDGAAVVMTVGAAGGLNVALRAICDPGDEIIVLAPYFPEYRFYIEQAGARMVVVQTDAQFQPDIAAIQAALSAHTRGLIVNSPNNPSGAVYAESCCRELAAVLQRHDRPDRPLYVLLDDPYRRLVYEGAPPASLASCYPRSVLISSFSKDVSLAGERIGYIAVPAGVPDRQLLLGAMTILNRTLGFVNAPALMQRVIARCVGAACDFSFYRRNRDLLCRVLRHAGYELIVPGGSMFVFPRTPIDDDVAFVQRLLEQRILTVPGTGFGRPGHMRVSFAVAPHVIERAAPGFQAAFRAAAR